MVLQFRDIIEFTAFFFFFFKFIVINQYFQCHPGISAAAIGSEIYIFGGELCVHGGTPVKFVKQAMPILLDEMHVLDTNAMSWTQVCCILFSFSPFVSSFLYN